MNEKSKRMRRILIMAGGTGGHIFPGLAVADYFRAQGVDVHWLGTSQGLEARLVPDANYPLHLIAIQGVRRKGVFMALKAPVGIIKAVLEAKRIIRSLQPDVVIGMGGFVSGPGGIASWLLGRPLIIHEQNARAGLTNRWLACFAKRVLEGFPAAFLSRKKVTTVGNPVRTLIEAIGKRSHIEQDTNTEIAEQHEITAQASRFRLLVLGGSLGAQMLNELLPQALALLNTEERPEIWHQTGNKNIEAASALYAKYNVQVKLEPFITDMAAAYDWADMVLCRAGALTVAELCAAGVGAILIPYPHAVDDHQAANANFMVKAGAALCIRQETLTVSLLVGLIRQFSSDGNRRMMMAKAAYELRKEQVPATIFKICQEVCH